VSLLNEEEEEKRMRTFWSSSASQCFKNHLQEWQSECLKILEFYKKKEREKKKR
jgi:hypothetical protein